MKKSCVGFIIFIVCLIFMGNKPINKINAENGWKDYKINEVDLYNETNTYAYNFIENDDEPNQYFDMTTYEEKSISTGEPLITVLTPGLGSNADTWSLIEDENGETKFTYLDDSIITRLSNLVGEANIYWYKFTKEKKFKIINLSTQINKIKNGYITEFKDSDDYLYDENYKLRITDISKPIIILFESSDPGASNDYVYEEFNYAISKAVYDVKYLNNGVLPKLNLVGHSRGGLTNLQYALDHPKLVHSMYSIGTPYLGSTSATFDEGIGGVFGYVSEGEKNIVNKDIYMNYVERWNNNYGLYENINVHALGGYSSLQFLINTFINQSAISAALNLLFVTMDVGAKLLEKGLIDNNIYVTKVMNAARKVLSNDMALLALENIIHNEIYSSNLYPHLYIKNDFFVDLDSQLGEKLINFEKITYKGFKQQSFCFTEENSDREALAKRVEGGPNYSIVHNLETRHKDIIDYIVKNISMSGKIDELYETYDIGSNEIGIRTILKNVSHTTLQIPSTINGKTVVEIAPSAFSNDFNSNRYITGQHAPITKVIIPNTVRKIGANAFENCSELRIVEFESNSLLYEIGDYAFYNCPLLNSINTPSNVVLGECIFLNNNLILDEEYNSEIYSKVNNLGSINCMMEELRGDYYLYKDFSMHFKFSVECEYEYDFNAIADEGIKMWLYDSNLELLFEESTSINDGTNTAIIENLTPGDYYLRITAEDGNYDGSVEVIVDNDIAEKEELLVDTETDVLEHLHNGHNEFFFMRNKTDFYEFWLIAEDSGEVIFPEGAITIFDSNGNIVEKFTIDNLDYSNSADSIYSATSITVLIEEYMNYYIHIDIDPNIEYSSLKIVALSLGARNLDSEDNLVETDNKIGDKIDIINVERTGHYDLDITYNGNQEEEILYVILKKDSNNNFTLIDKFLLNSENNAINENYIFNGGEVLYIGYFNYLGNGNIKLEISRIIKQKFDLIVDPNMNVVVGTEVSVNKGSCNETTITQGYTRVCYLGMYAPNLDSRMLYEWSSSDETIAKVSSYGTITATATWTDNATCKKVKIKATYQSNITIVGEIEIEVYKDTRTDEKYLQYGMDVRETSPITGNEVTTGKGYPIPVSTSPTVVIHKSNTRLICLGNDSPSKIIQDFTWTSLDPSVAVVSQYGTITGYHSGETKILGVYKYNPRFKVEIILVVVTGL